jgi:branched-chain amino acid transport system substrate-binding protein
VRVQNIRLDMLVVLMGLSLLFAPKAFAENGVTENSIKIGSTAALTSTVQEHGQALKAGAQLYWNRVNASGGVNGRKVELIVLDDGFEPANAAENTNKLINQDKVFALVSSHGTASVMASMPTIKKSGIPFFAPIVGTEEFYKPIIKNVFLVRRSFYGEAEALASIIVDKFGDKEIGIFRDSAGLGNSGRSAFDMALRKRDLKLVAEGQYAINSKDVSAGFKALFDAKPKAIVMWSSPLQTVEFLKLAKAKNWQPKFFFSNPSFADITIKTLSEVGIKSTFFMDPVPYFTDTSYEIVKQYIADTTAAKIPPHFLALESYINSAIFHEGLKRAGKTLTRDSLIAALEGMHDVVVGGVKVSFSPTKHQGIDRFFMVEYKDGKLTPVDPDAINPADVVNSGK